MVLASGTNWEPLMSELLDSAITTLSLGSSSSSSWWSFSLSWPLGFESMMWLTLPSTSVLVYCSGSDGSEDSFCSMSECCFSSYPKIEPEMML